METFIAGSPDDKAAMAGGGTLGDDLEGLDEETEASLRRFLANPSAPSRLYGFKWDEGFVAPWVPCDGPSLQEALEVLQLSTDDFVLDLGCGDGRVLIEAVERSACCARGVELDEALLAQAAESATRLPAALRNRISFVAGDMFDLTLWVETSEDDGSCAGSAAGSGTRWPTVVILYLLTQSLQQLQPLLEPLLAQGTRVCTLRWQFPGWQAHECARGAGWYLYGPVHGAP
mmetsp:Transcript_69159/g.214502  ORF Transcript_69159/g.214502 Transcript_69159/m.214502 type:complete len:231 (+) Transcript_69159:103-795(+)